MVATVGSVIAALKGLDPSLPVVRCVSSGIER